MSINYSSHPGGIVYVGVKFVNKFATVALLCVIFSIIAVYTGIFYNIHGNDKLKWVEVCAIDDTLIQLATVGITNVNNYKWKFHHQFSTHNPRSMCVVGKRLVKDILPENCTKIVDGPLWQSYCELQNNTKNPKYTRDFDAYKLDERNWVCDSYFQSEYYKL